MTNWFILLVLLGAVSSFGRGGRGTKVEAPVLPTDAVQIRQLQAQSNHFEVALSVQEASFAGSISAVSMSQQNALIDTGWVSVPYYELPFPHMGGSTVSVSDLIGTNISPNLIREFYIEISGEIMNTLTQIWMIGSNGWGQVGVI